MQEKSGGRPVVRRKEPRQQPRATSQKKRDSFNDENKGKAWGSDEQVGGRRKEEGGKEKGGKGKGAKGERG